MWMKNELSEYTEVERGIQERYVFSPNLFIMHRDDTKRIRFIINGHNLMLYIMLLMRFTGRTIRQGSQSKMKEWTINCKIEFMEVIAQDTSYTLGTSNANNCMNITIWPE